MSLLHYGADMFTDSGRNSGTARRKAKFVNLLLDFIADGCPRDRFAVKIVANLASAQIALHVDVNCGDPIWPAPTEA